MRIARAAESTVPGMQTIRTPEKDFAFLATLADTGNVTKSAAAVGASRRVVYEWRLADQDFAEAWDQAIRVATLGLEDEARRRAQEGVEEPVFYLGGQCGTIRKYSDTLLIFLLKAHDHKYREKTGLELSNPDGSLQPLSDAQAAGRIAALIAVAQARQAQEASDEPGADLV